MQYFKVYGLTLWTTVYKYILLFLIYLYFELLNLKGSGGGPGGPGGGGVGGIGPGLGDGLKGILPNRSSIFNILLSILSSRSSIFCNLSKRFGFSIDMIRGINCYLFIYNYPIF
jgi:hypothetical protein